MINNQELFLNLFESIIIIVIITPITVININNIIMNNSDYNSVNKIISILPERTEDNQGIIIVRGVDDYSQVNVDVANSKHWKVINKIGNIISISAGNNIVTNKLLNNKKIKNVYLGNDKLL